MSISAKQKDKFWKLYITIISFVGLFLVVIFVVLFTTKIFHTDADGIVLGLYDESTEQRFVEKPEIYENILAQGWEDWSWGAVVDFSSFMTADRKNSIRVNFKEQNAGFMIHAPHFDTSHYKSVKLSLYNVGNEDKSGIFIEITDKNDKSVGKQSLSWYMDEKTFKPGKWYDISVPLDNLDASNSNINGISVISDNPGIIYIDDIKFSDEDIYFPRWIEGAETVTEKEQVQPIILNHMGSSTPYISDFYHKKDEWRALGGILETSFNKMRLETGTTSNYAMFLLKGGESWINYRYNVYIDWAMGDSINLLARYSPDNFFSCSFFDDGVNVTLYQSQNGKLKELDSAPNFTIYRKYSWSKTQSLGVEVKGDEVSCLTNGEVKVKHKASYPMPLMGGAAIEMWSPNNGQSSMSVNKVVVEGL